MSFWTRWLDVESWEQEGTHATSRAEMWEGSVQGQANPLRGPGPLAPTLKCMEAGKPAQRWAGDAQMGLRRIPKAKLDELLLAL